ncbi:MAG TPA: gas vesicle protein GvpG [Thermoanaerobaculia bacterium]|nr:gas vesicle protein GvpG [Thermoanaerobaculia bacterium]
MAFLLDDILLLPITGPIAGFRWVMTTIQKMADEELMNDQPWKERLIELQMRLELGEISEDEYVVQEAEVFQALRDIRARKEALARQYAAEQDEEDGGIGVYTGYGDR